MLKKYIFIIILSICMLSVTNGAKLYLSPENMTGTYDCQFAVDVMIDTQGRETTAVDVKLFEDTGFVIDGVNIQGGVFDSCTSLVKGKALNPKYKSKKYSAIMCSKSTAKGFNGIGKIATFLISPNSLDKMFLQFYMVDGYAGDDSNIAVIKKSESALDGLTEVINANYVFVKGPCINLNMPNVPFSFNSQLIINNNISTGISEYPIDALKYPDDLSFWSSLLSWVKMFRQNLLKNIS